jgi:GYF domain 2
MKKYFLHNGTEQQGPFDLDDLKAKLINKDTPIWYEGIPEWTTAEKIDDLKEVLRLPIPPPFEIKQSAPPSINRQTPQEVPIHDKSSTPKEEYCKQTNFENNPSCWSYPRWTCNPLQYE